MLSCDLGSRQVPVRQDYADLYNILAFFDGGLGPTREGHHDNLAENIAEAGRDWAYRYWRRVDMQACSSLLGIVSIVVLLKEKNPLGRFISLALRVCTSGGCQSNGAGMIFNAISLVSHFQ